jgi:hypothetical protein
VPPAATLTVPPVSVERTSRHRLSPTGFWPRLLLVATLSVLTHTVVIWNVVTDAAAGSRAVIVVLLPILAAMVAIGYRRPPRGVSDAESDWIVAFLGTLAGLTVLTLLSNRFPTFAGFWRLDLVAIVVWVAGSAMVMFGIRYVVRVWDLWVFAFGCASPIPFLLTGAALGGSNLALAAQSCALAALAVVLAGRTRPLVWRLATAAAAFAAGLGVSALLLAAIPGRLALLVATVAGAGLIPLVAAGVLLRFARPRGAAPRPPVTATFPHRSRISVATLLMLAMVTALTGYSAHRAEPSVGRADWIARSGLTPTAQFDFITRYLGSGATLRRYAIGSAPDSPRVVVDVLSTPDPGALADFADAVWYPTSRPINYRPITLPGRALPMRVAHTDGTAAVSEDAADWYLLSWTWQAGALTQQVNIVVAQQSSGAIPDPVPLTLAGAAGRPVAWILRQQPNPIDYVDERVVDAAAHTASRLLDVTG